MSHDFFALRLSEREFELLVRLIGHHTGGNGFDRIYAHMHEARKDAAMAAENKGPLCKDHPIAAKDIYGDRPVVRVNV